MGTEAEATAILGENRSEWPEVAIIVLNWNNYEDTAECLESLKQINYPNYRVIVVDNGSSDGSPDKLQDEFEWCEFIFNDRNLGFSAGCNTGIRSVNSSAVKYVFLLNNDAVVRKNTLIHLVGTAESNENVAAVGGVIVDPSDNEILYSGGEVNLKKSSASISNETPHTEEYETEYITGAMVLIPLTYLEKIGYLPEDYFFGTEDLEFSYKSKLDGKRLIINSRAVSQHKENSTVGEASAFKYYHFSINRMIFASKNLKIYWKTIFCLFFLVSRVVRIVQWTVNNRFDLIRATLLAVLDFLRFRSPQRRTELLSDTP
jgi:GT2 family glycosyltransferase